MEEGEKKESGEIVRKLSEKKKKEEEEKKKKERKKKKGLVFKIPLTFGSLERIKRRSAFFKRFVRNVSKDSKMATYLEQDDADITAEEYYAVCISGLVMIFVISFLVASTAFVLLDLNSPFLLALILSALAGIFVFFSRYVYPRVYNRNKQRDIEKDLIAALQDMLVQLNSGIPLFTILVNISLADYGSLSLEFQKIVKKINAGYSQVEVLEEIGEKNASLFFRRALWQISNGMRAGGDIGVVIKESIKTLSEEQLIQIQIYGNKLNPAIMFYMLTTVIIPALSITFLTVLSSLISFKGSFATLFFLSLFVFVLLIQVMFLGMLKSIRPSLM